MAFDDPSFRQIGAALVALQVTERIIRLCMTIVLQKSNPLTLEVLQNQERGERKKTLGYFLAELRKRADLAPEFDALLEEYLESRNVFVHNLIDIPGCGLTSKDSRPVINEFVGHFMEMNEKVLSIFVGMMRAWQKQNELEDHFSEGQAFFAEIDEQVVPVLNEIFKAKAPDT